MFINNVRVGAYTVTPTSGQQGYGGYNLPSAGSGFIYIGHHDAVAPAAISGNIPRSAYSSSISFQWPATARREFGIYRYEVYRNGSVIGYTDPGTRVFTERTASASTPYTYAFDAMD